MTKIMKAPFNFVPQASTIYTPEWADQISQDIPFEDGLDGSIDVKITACSPIFVKNGTKRKRKEDTTLTTDKFSQTADGRYFIPGSSVKGAIRNVLEIMSMGKLSTDPNAQFAQREWGNPDLYTLKDPTIQIRDIKGGWLCENEDGTYTIQESKKIYRINHLRLDKILGGDIFESHFKKGAPHFDLNKPQKIGDKEYDPKTANYKYALIAEAGKTHIIEKEQSFSPDEEYNTERTTNRLCGDKNGEIRGYIVLTGQPDQANKWEDRQNKGSGKFYEFVFDSEITKKHTITREEFEHFKFIYQDSSDWAYATNRMQSKTGMPIFFRKDKKTGIKDFGLALLYKLPYDNTPLKIEEQRQGSKKTKKDLSECIFGYISDKESLKGRVQFSHFYAQDGAQEETTATRLILNSPKASYYPIYIKQEGKGGIVSNQYKTYNDGELKGFKRYLTRKEVWHKNMNNDKLDTLIVPLKKGTEFTGKINFHNLKRVELGALISALTFHLTKDKNIYHQIGQGKPYGYGKVKIDISTHLTGEEIKDKILIGIFEEEMSNISPMWLTSNTLKELFTIAHEEITADDALFRYMEMDVDNKNNEFITAKGGDNGNDIKEYLEYYSKLKSAEFGPKKACDEEYIEWKKEHMGDPTTEPTTDTNVETLIADIQNRIISRIMKTMSGLEFLNKQDDNGSYKIKDFNTASRNITKWLKISKRTDIPSDQIQIIEEFLERIYPTMKARDQKEWNFFEGSHRWATITDWVGKEKAQEMFNKLIK